MNVYTDAEGNPVPNEQTAVCTWEAGGPDVGLGVATVILPATGSTVTLSVAEDRALLVTDVLASTTSTCDGPGGAARVGSLERIEITGTPGDDRAVIDDAGPRGFPDRMTVVVALQGGGDDGPDADLLTYVGPAAGAHLRLEDAGIRRAQSACSGEGDGLRLSLEGVEALSLDLGDGNDVVDAARWSGPSLTIAMAGGNDRFISSPAGDVVDGGPSTAPDDPGFRACSGIAADIVSYAGAAGGVTVDLGVVGVPQATGAGGDDVLSGFEAVEGSASGDVLVGGPRGAVLLGGAGDDVLSCGDGTGDWVSYRDAAPADGGVAVDLRSTAPQDTGWGTDTISGCEGVFGSDGDDVLRGTRASDRLWGSDGDDRLIGSGGPDSLDGGSGVDVADYSWSTSRVVAWLSPQTAGADPYASVAGIGVDRLDSIEHMIGGRDDDVIIGSRAANSLRGGPGDDVLYGRGGDDRLLGGRGFDEMIGAGGQDRCVVGPGGGVVRSCET